MEALDTVGLLVYGDNHFVVRGPWPDGAMAFALVQHWSVIQIGAATPPALRPWRISTKEFREELQWAFVIAGAGEVTPAIATLLAELEARGVRARNVC